MKNKIPRTEALNIWGELSSPLPKCFKYEVCGSIRRLSPFVGDCDIVTDADANTILSSLKVFLPDKIQLLISGEHKLRFLFKDFQFDFQICQFPEEMGASMLYFTALKSLM